MTREEAIDRLMWLKGVPHINDDKWIEAVDIAIEALSKPNYETDTEVKLAVTNRKKEKVILWDAFGEVQYYPIEALQPDAVSRDVYDKRTQADEEIIRMIVICHEDDYFERTPIEKQRVCCNCRNRKTSEIVSKCMIDGHYIGYVQCFTNWCKHWATDELKWIGGDSE